MSSNFIDRRPHSVNMNLDSQHGHFRQYVKWKPNRRAEVRTTIAHCGVDRKGGSTLGVRRRDSDRGGLRSPSAGASKAKATQAHGTIPARHERSAKPYVLSP
jgi:hypothetical protein